MATTVAMWALCAGSCVMPATETRFVIAEPGVAMVRWSDDGYWDTQPRFGWYRHRYYGSPWRGCYGLPSYALDGSYRYCGYRASLYGTCWRSRYYCERRPWFWRAYYAGLRAEAARWDARYRVEQPQPPTPLTVGNPYVTESEGGVPAESLDLPAPLRIVNPYVARVGDPSVAPDAVMPAAPEIVYPASTAGRSSNAGS